MLERFAVILLAGGKSSRTTIPKGLIEKDGIPWLTLQQEKIAHLGLGNCFLVMGTHERAYVSLLHPAFTACTNPLPKRGPFSSIIEGVRILKPKVNGVFILPMDVPCPRKEVWLKLAENLVNHVAVVPENLGKGGHPVLLSWRYCQVLVKVPTDSPEARLDFQLRKLNPSEVVRVNVQDHNIIRNLNTDLEFKEYFISCVS